MHIEQRIINIHSDCNVLYDHGNDNVFFDINKFHVSSVYIPLYKVIFKEKKKHGIFSFQNISVKFHFAYNWMQ